MLGFSVHSTDKILLDTGNRRTFQVFTTIINGNHNINEKSN